GYSPKQIGHEHQAAIQYSDHRQFAAAVINGDLGGDFVEPPQNRWLIKEHTLEVALNTTMRALTTCPRTFGCCETTIINRNASRARQSFSYDRHHNAPAMGGPAMLKQVNTLPGPKLQPPFDNGDNLAGASQSHFDV